MYTYALVRDQIFEILHIKYIHTDLFIYVQYYILYYIK